MFRVGERFEFFGQLLLFLREFPGVTAHLAHIVGKPIRALFAKVVGELLQLALRACAGTERLRRGIVVQRLGGALDVGTRFVELLPGVGHARLVFRAFHSLAQLVNVRQHFLLFFAQTLQSTSNFIALSLALRLLERGLELLEPLVQVLLALR